LPTLCDTLFRLDTLTAEGGVASMRIQSKLMALAVISTLAVALAGCLSARSDTVADAAALVIALPIYAIACAGGGCRGWTGMTPEQHRQMIEDQQRQLQGLRAEWKARAEQGDPEAQVRVYHLSPPSPERLKWLCLAANQGFAEAQNALGASYRFGWDMERDLVQAYKWYALEIEAGDTDARRDLEDIAPSMTPAQIAEGERLATEWTPESPCPSAVGAPTAVTKPADPPEERRFAATSPTGTPVRDTPSARVVDPAGRCAPSVRHMGDSYCATDPNN
jgi:hypothetical protein